MNKTLLSKSWWMASLNRAVRTVAQTAVASIGTAALFQAVDWRIVIGSSLLAGFTSILTSLAGLPEVDLLEFEERAEK